MGKVHVTIYHYDYFICLVCVNINTSCIISYTNILCVNDHVISEVGWTDLLWTGIHQDYCIVSVQKKVDSYSQFCDSQFTKNYWYDRL